MLSCVAGGAQLEPPVRVPHTVHVKTLYRIGVQDYCRHHIIRAAVAAGVTGGVITGVRPAPGRWWPGPGSNPRDVVDSHPRCVVSVPAGGQGTGSATRGWPSDRFTTDRTWQPRIRGGSGTGAYPRFMSDLSPGSSPL